MRIVLLLLLSSYIPWTFAQSTIVNLYAYADAIPPKVIQDFEHETGITVNYSTFDSNEAMYAKLHSVKNPGYDVLFPSSYTAGRLRKEGFLAPLDKKQIPNLKYLSQRFRNRAFDPEGKYAVPFVWGMTGIFYNSRYHPKTDIRSWQDLWSNQYHNLLILPNDSRECFSMALIVLGYSPNDENPKHLRQAYEKLSRLKPNIKLFNTDAAPAFMIDEDVTVGMAWNGAVYMAMKENPAIRFVFPKEGFTIWVDTLLVAKDAPHKKNAMRLIDYLLRPEMSKRTIEYYGFATTNTAAIALLDKSIRNNPIIFPTDNILKRGYFQKDVSDATMKLYEHYWELLKLN